MLTTHNPKVELKHALIANATVAYTEPETGQDLILLINQVIKMKCLDHHLLCPMQCCVNGVLIDVVPKFLAPISSETMHGIQLVSLF